MQNEGVLMSLRNMPNVGRTLGRFALGLLALLCVLYALYMAFLMPPLLKYGDGGARADGRLYCAQEASRVEISTGDFKDAKGNVDWWGAIQAQAAKQHTEEVACLSETAVNTPLLVFRAAVLLIIGFASALLASRLRTN